MAVHKKPVNTASNAADAKEKVVVSDVVTETTERIEVVGEASSVAPSSDPLTDFKEKMEKEEYFSSQTSPQKNFMWPILFIFIIAILLLTGVFVYKQGIFKEEKINVVTLRPTPTIAPSPAKTIDLSKYPIMILNGSGVDGEAGRQRGNLEGEGFTVSSVGNAANSDYTSTIIQVKKTVEKEFLDKLKSVLEESFIVGETEELPEDADSNIIVIIGSQTN